MNIRKLKDRFFEIVKKDYNNLSKFQNYAVFTEFSANASSSITFGNARGR